VAGGRKFDEASRACPVWVRGPFIETAETTVPPPPQKRMLHRDAHSTGLITTGNRQECHGIRIGPTKGWGPIGRLQPWSTKMAGTKNWENGFAKECDAACGGDWMRRGVLQKTDALRRYWHEPGESCRLRGGLLGDGCFLTGTRFEVGGTFHAERLVRRAVFATHPPPTPRHPLSPGQAKLNSSPR